MSAGGARPRCSQAVRVATRPRGVRASRPERTRNGSATSSTVSRSSPTATASVLMPTGPPPKRRQSASSTARSRRSRPGLVDLEQLEGRAGQVAGHHAVGPHLREVADPPQEAVGDARGAPRAGRDLDAGGLLHLDVEQVGRAPHDALEVGGLVELQVGGEAEPVAQRAGEQTGTGGRPHERERGDVERDRGGAGPLADDDVDPEVLHRHVEHLLGRSRHAVDLVDEEDVALVEPGEDGGQVTGMRDRRTAGQPEGRGHLGGDDHRQRRLAQAGRAAEQHVVGRAPTGLGGARAAGRAARRPDPGPRPRPGCAAAAPPRRRAPRCRRRPP